jgi:hypothetical protein
LKKHNAGEVPHTSKYPPWPISLFHRDFIFHVVIAAHFLHCYPIP